MNAVLEQILEGAKPELQTFIVESKSNFQSTFGTWVASQHAGRLEEVFTMAGKARLRALLGKLQGDAAAEKDALETYEASVASLETLGLGIEVTGKVAAHQFLQGALHGVLSAVAAVFGIAIQASISVVLPGFGIPVGGLAGEVVEKFLDFVFGV